MRLTPKAPFPENIIPGKTHAVLRRRTFQYLQALCSPELPTVFTVIHKGPRHADFPNRTAQKAVFTHVPAVCLEGALSKTHVFKETEGEPMIVRRAKAFKRHCETKTITIQPGELVVGNAGRTARTIHICPELSNNWVYEELDTMATRPQRSLCESPRKQKMLFRNEIYPVLEGQDPARLLERASPQAHPRHHLGGRRHRQRHQDRMRARRNHAGISGSSFTQGLQGYSGRGAGASRCRGPHRTRQL